MADRHPRVRLNAAWALGELRDSKAVESLKTALADNDAAVRKNAIWALGRIGNSAATPALVRLLNDDDAEIRNAACLAIGRLRDADAVHQLVRALADSSGKVRLAAAWAIRQLDRQIAVQSLNTALSTGPRASAAALLGFFGDQAATEPLIPLLEDKADSVRWTAAWALGEIRDPRSCQALLRVLSDREAWCRCCAVEALGKIGDREAVHRIADMLKDKETWVRFSAAVALASLADARATESLIAALSDESRSVRHAAALALSTSRDALASAALERLLTDSDPVLQWVAAKRLGQVRDPRPALIELESRLKHVAFGLSRRKPKAWGAAWVLGEMQDSRAVAPLLKAVSDDDAELRARAAFALGRIADRRALDALRKLLNDPEQDLRVAASAAAAIRQLEGPRMNPAGGRAVHQAPPTSPATRPTALRNGDIQASTQHKSTSGETADSTPLTYLTDCERSMVGRWAADEAEIPRIVATLMAKQAGIVEPTPEQVQALTQTAREKLRTNVHPEYTIALRPDKTFSVLVTVPGGKAGSEDGTWSCTESVPSFSKIRLGRLSYKAPHLLLSSDPGVHGIDMSIPLKRTD